MYNAATSSVRILVDVVGYYGDAGARFFPISPARVYDSRSPLPNPGPLPAGGERVVYAGDGRDAPRQRHRPRRRPAWQPRPWPTT